MSEAEYVNVEYVREALDQMRVDVEEELSLELPSEKARAAAERIVKTLTKEFRRGLTPEDLGFFFELKEIIKVIRGAPIGKGKSYYLLILTFAEILPQIARRGPLGSEEEALLRAVEEAHALIIGHGSQGA